MTVETSITDSSFALVLGVLDTSTRKALKEARFPRTPKNLFLLKVWHENLQKGRNEGRPKTVRKDKQKKLKS